ncbi:MAG TPA: bifunctional 4-hydroxy-2-oxoglutarate aldolase/2-dehydro-3-deoxy-phosphogluconate aldolase [Solirubrobacterales bacterium]|nr:bifunctional 4-hydroxy-2-oxoglutarate aldolase/2-dehydro-3-deoxy-phosphogluconate aldolase [Solirubrobacterales bacterium]
MSSPAPSPASRVLPIATIAREDEALPLARAVLAGGLSSLEVTLRTPVALAAIAAIAEGVPEIEVGAGTVHGLAEIEAARAAGARFLASAATSAALRDPLLDCGLPVLCGVSTPVEVAELAERGIFEMKLFPAEAIGGTAWLEAIAGPFPKARFLVSGGIGRAQTASYLDQPNVLAVGAGWVCARDPRTPDWLAVQAAARAAAELGGGLV